MAYTFRPAEPDEVEAIFRLYADRIRWMEKKGIRQWNVTGYLEAYPIRYYMRRQSLGDLFVLVSDDTVTGAVVLLQEDDRWPDGADHTALYIHHLVTDPRVSGAGRVLLAKAEGAALQQKKTRYPSGLCRGQRISERVLCLAGLQARGNLPRGAVYRQPAGKSAYPIAPVRHFGGSRAVSEKSKPASIRGYLPVFWSR